MTRNLSRSANLQKFLSITIATLTMSLMYKAHWGTGTVFEAAGESRSAERSVLEEHGEERATL